MKIGVISDLHYAKSKNVTNPTRCGERAPELLKKAVDFFNDRRPDVLLVAGDMINDPAEAPLLGELAEILERAAMPYLAIPGNHDPAPEVFYRYLPAVPDYLEIGGFRIVPFPDDYETPHWNARRTPEDVARLKRLGQGEVPLILFQHVPLFVPRTVYGCLYNYDNAEEIIAAAGNTVLSISGHWHFGYCPSFDSPFVTVAVPGLCEKNFPVTLIEIGDDGGFGAMDMHYFG